MTEWYAFNGDADGLCAQQQLRLAAPGDAMLVTGVKRDIHLLERVPAQARDTVTVLDISLDQNRAGLQRLLEAGASVRYFDHHFAGDIPTHPALQAHIDESADVCTSILVDRHVGGRFKAWAITAAFGDNLASVAQAMARAMGMSTEATATLEQLGTCLNYNAYGESVADLHVDPAALAQEMLPFADPAEFAAGSPVCRALVAGYREDMDRGRRLEPFRERAGATVLLMPDAAWARRAIGVLANERIRNAPGQALAILSPKSGGGFSVSVRTPRAAASSAADFCRRFETGGGRQSAGGINHLPDTGVDSFVAAFDACYAAG
ncbi:MAG TPA: acetyltransferase [Noviherbaspirillum sp.]|nr:acetyltransferase [Noviherbaspirillum sp.]